MINIIVACVLCVIMGCLAPIISDIAQKASEKLIREDEETDMFIRELRGESVWQTEERN